MRHKLKCWPDEFEAMADGRKRFEFRKDDRDFKVYDELLLEEFLPCKDCHGTGRSYHPSDNGEGSVCGCPEPHGKFTGRYREAIITFILSGGRFDLPKGYAILSIRLCQ